MIRKTLSTVCVVGLALAGCGGSDEASTPTDGAEPTDVVDTAGADDTTPEDTAPADTTGDDTAPEDTAPADTAGDDTAPDTGGVTISDSGRLVPVECSASDNVAAESDGVTEDSANVAVLSIDFSKLAEIGFAASDRDPTELFSVFADEINDNGGICGRSLDVQRITYNILAAEGGQACVEATEDRNNLMVSTAAYTEVLCLTDAGIPVSSSNDLTQAEMDAANGLLFTRFPTVEAQYEATVQYAADQGALDGKVGVWYGGIFPAQTQAAEDIVLPMLDEMGVDYEAFRNDSAGPSDPQGNAILTAAATQFASTGIDTLLQFVQNTNQTGIQAELNAQGSDPRYISMPISANTANDLFVERFGTAPITDGQQWVTFTKAHAELKGDDALSQACHDIWTERTGETVESATYDYTTIVTTCVYVDELVAAMSLAGGDLNRATLTSAFEQLPAHVEPRLLGEVDWSTSHFGSPTFSVQTLDSATMKSSTAAETFVVEE